MGRGSLCARMMRAQCMREIFFACVISRLRASTSFHPSRERRNRKPEMETIAATAQDNRRPVSVSFVENNRRSGVALTWSEATESGSLCVPTKSPAAFLELELAIRTWEMST
jgi:hypothetical protein